MANLEQNIKRAISSIDNLQTAIENEIGESMENVPIERYVEILQAIFQKRKDITDIYIGYVFDETGSGSNQKGLCFVFSDGSEKIVALPDIFSQELSLEQVEDGVMILFNDAGVVKDYKISNGVGIEKIEKTSSVGLVDTYTITLTDGNTTTFTVTNGSSSDGFNPDGDGTIIPSVEIDPTLTQEGVAADAKAVGDKLAYVDESIENLENSLLEQINGLNDTVTRATEKVNGFEETVNNNTAEIESLQEQYSGLEENIGTELSTLDSKIPNVATVENNILKVQHKEHIGTPTTLFEVELPESAEVPTKTSQLENDSKFVTAEYVTNAINGSLDEVEAMIDESGVLDE